MPELENVWQLFLHNEVIDYSADNSEMQFIMNNVYHQSVFIVYFLEMMFMMPHFVRSEPLFIYKKVRLIYMSNFTYPIHSRQILKRIYFVSYYLLRVQLFIFWFLIKFHVSWAYMFQILRRFTKFKHFFYILLYYLSCF